MKRRSGDKQPIRERHLGIVGQRIACVAFACLMPVASTSALAWDETKPGLRMALSVDVYRAGGSMVASARYGGSWGMKIGAWVRDVHVVPRAPNVVVGADYALMFSKWRFGAGVAWIDEENNMNGTRWNFDLSVAHDLSDRVFLQYQHYSHGSGLRLERDVANASWNLLGVGVLF
jgi:hypothetical protein